jgi:hypothetical protein
MYTIVIPTATAGFGPYPDDLIVNVADLSVLLNDEDADPLADHAARIAASLVATGITLAEARTLCDQHNALDDAVQAVVGGYATPEQTALYEAAVDAEEEQERAEAAIASAIASQQRDLAELAADGIGDGVAVHAGALGVTGAHPDDTVTIEPDGSATVRLTIRLDAAAMARLTDPAYGDRGIPAYEALATAVDATNGWLDRLA